MAGVLIKLFSSMISHLFRRGKGLFKFLFVIDDFIRLFTMTIIIPNLLMMINAGRALVISGLLLGLVIDLQDYISEYGVGKME